MDLDQPCMAAFAPTGYPTNRFVPSEAPEAARLKVRGVVARSLLWRPGETLQICFRCLPPWLFKGGEKSPCVVATNYELSDRDKQFMASTYPKGPQVVATAPETATTRSSKARTQSKFVEEYKKALREAGVEPAKVESLAKEFSASLAPP